MYFTTEAAQRSSYRDLASALTETVNEISDLITVARNNKGYPVSDTLSGAVRAEVANFNTLVTEMQERNDALLRGTEI